MDLHSTMSDIYTYFTACGILFYRRDDRRGEGLTIVVALKMSDVDEIIFPMIESIGSIILVAEK